MKMGEFPQLGAQRPVQRDRVWAGGGGGAGMCVALTFMCFLWVIAPRESGA